MQDKRKIIYYIIVIIGLLQSIGYVTQIENIRNLGVLTSASPLPLVFTEVDGIEAFAADFYIQWKDDSNEVIEIKITPTIYAQLKGPYNRRNAYGAAIAGGPILPETIWKPVLRYGLCEDVLENELGLDIDKETFSLLIKTRTKGRNDQWIHKVDCQ